MTAGASRLVGSVLPELVAALLADLADWTAARRLRGAALLATAVRYVHPNLQQQPDPQPDPQLQADPDASLVSHLPLLLPALARCVHDDERPVAEQVQDAARLLGCHLPPHATPPYLYAALGVAADPSPLLASSASSTCGAALSQSWVSSHSAMAASASTSLIASSTSSMGVGGSASQGQGARSPAGMGAHQLANSLALLAGILAGWAQRDHALAQPDTCV